MNKSGTKQRIEKYQPQKIESKWNEIWETEGVNRFDKNAKGEIYYNLVELPYPSGDLHIGHWFTFVNPDIHARFMRMKGKNVFFPNGFDAFGLPAENAAIKRHVNPKEWTLGNVASMRQQFNTMGTMIDWNHSVITCLPEYYTWNQWIFLRMLEKGLAYRGSAMANWCPVDQTVLANENVEQGKCWRCGAEVVQKEIPQWFLRITAYADELIWPENPEVNWPKKVRIAQNEWIGKSEGAEIKFSVIPANEPGSGGTLYKGSGIPHQVRDDKIIKVFTTRPDTLYGATFIIVAPEHPLVSEITTNEQKDIVQNYVQEAAKKSELERKEMKVKTGVFTGAYAIHPLTQENLPIWIADYVLVNYGTGAIMAVPGHDERDFEFAKKYNLPIKQVIAPETGTKRKNEERRDGGCAIVFDPKTQKYGVYEREDGQIGFFAGGVGKDEDIQEGILREVREESGLHNFKHVEEIAKAFTHFHNSFKNLDRSAMATCLLIILENADVQETKLEEHEKFYLVWKTAEEIRAGLHERNQEKDVDHWLRFLELAVGRAIELGYDKTSSQEEFKQTPYIGSGIIINSNGWDGLRYPEDKGKIIKDLEEKGVGKKAVTYHLRDWSISRQRYWGTPIPVIHCKKCGIVPVPEGELPVELPEITDYQPKGKPPLATATEWVNVPCPKCGGEAKRDTETMDTFVDSSWYYYRYMNPHYNQAPFSKDDAQTFMPVDIYFGGSEHTLGHTLYARFFTKFFKELGMVEFGEFAKRRAEHGIVLGPDGNKMSKSKGNVINPDEVVKEYGADATRTYLSFMMPYEGTSPWSTDAIAGVYRFLRRVWELSDKVKQSAVSSQQSEDLYEMHRTIKKVTEDLEDIKFNTAVAALMEWLNYLSRKETIGQEEYKAFLLLLAPFAPFMTEEIWQRNYTGATNFSSIHKMAWPVYNENYLVKDELTIVVQVNGKVRDTIVVSREDSKNQEKVAEIAQKSEKVNKHLGHKGAKKIFYIQGKLLNLISA